MSKRPRGLRQALTGVALLCVTTATLPASADGPAPLEPPVLSPADRELIALLEPFDLPTVSGKEFVRVWTGQAGQPGCCRGRAESLRFGFLLEETDEYFRVVHDLWPVTYSKTVQGLRGRAPRYEKTPFEGFALRPGRAGYNPQRVSWSRLVSAQARPSVSLGLVLLARAAWQRGLVAPATTLLALAREPRSMSGAASAGKTDMTLEALVAQELPRTLLWCAIESCSQPATGRATLLERFRRISARFPLHESCAPADTYAAVLASMVREDASHANAGAPPVPALSLGPELIELRAPIDGLIYQLRDLHAPHTPFRSAQVAHLEDPESPSSRLLAMHTVAVPQLLELADDTRLTRLIDGCPSDLTPEARVLRYGDVALQVLSRISGREFASHEAAAEWWADVQAHGEAAVLESMIREGERDAVALGRKLHALDPDRALSALMATAKDLTGSARERIVSYVASHKGARIDAFLLDEVRTAPALRTRLTAARTLHRHGDTRWSEPLISQLAQRSLTGTARHDAKRARDVIRFVVPNGSLYSLESLRRLYGHLDPDEKRNLLESAARIPRNHSDRSALCEAILTGALGDATHWPQPWSWNGVRCMDAELGEIAAVLLASQLGESFDPMAPPFERSLRVAELRNLCLTSRGLPPKPLPQEPELPLPSDPAELAAAVDALRAAAWPEELQAALDRIRAVGLPAVPALQEAIGREDLDPSAALKAREVLDTLASTVREVRVTDEIGALTAGDLSELRSLVGSPLTATRLRELIAKHTAESSSRVIHIAMHRDGRGRGVSLRVSIRQGGLAGRFGDRMIYSLRVGKRFSRNSLSLAHSKRQTSRTAERTSADVGWQRLESRLLPLLEGQATVDGELRLRLGR